MSGYASLSRRRFLSGIGVSGLALLSPFDRLAARPESGGPWQIGCYTRPWDKFEYRFALDAIAGAGFRYVGLMTTQSENRLIISTESSIEQSHRVGEEVRKRGLRVASVWGGGFPVEVSVKAGIEGLKRVIDNCSACGSASLLVGGTGDAGLLDAYIRVIAECCDEAAEKGVQIVLKPHGGLNATGPQCREWIEKVNHANFRLWYDPGNIFYYSNGELDPVDDAPSVDGLVSGMCVKDYLHPKNVLVTPGTGRVNFRRVFDLLRAGGFTGGPLIVECLTPGDPAQLLAEAKKAKQFLQDLTVGADESGFGSGPAPDSGLRAGIGIADITPPGGYRMSGYFSERCSLGASDPLKAKALVLEQGSQRLAYVACDLIGLPSEVTATARERIEMRTGIASSDVVIAATHTHTGPLYWGALRDFFHRRAVRREGSDSSETVDYAAELTAKIVSAVDEAISQLRPVALEAGAVQQPGLAFNRRFHMKDGSVRFNPGVLNPDIVRPAGPIDPQLGMLFLSAAGSSRPVAALINYALHLDTVKRENKQLFGADYPCALERCLREKYGPDFCLFFATGTCGDINHIDVTRRERPDSEQIGETLARTVIANEDRLQSLVPSLAVEREVVTVPLQCVDAEQIAQAGKTLEQIESDQVSFIEKVKAYKTLAIKERGGPDIALEVQAMRLSADVALVCLPGEVFVDLGLAIKKASPFPVTLVAELCQDAPGYIPTQKAFQEGSYETVNSRIAPGGGERMADAAIRLLRQLKTI